MQIKQLEYMRTIAEMGSITQAAQKLFISQQALSETLKLLEQELGFSIFERSNKGVVPTSAGEKFLQDLEQILPVIDSWKQLAENVQEKRTVKILVQYVLVDLLTNSNLVERLDNANEHIDIEWDTLHAKALLEKIKTESFCIGILQLIYGCEQYCRLEKMAENSEVVVVPLVPSKMVFALRYDDSLVEKDFLEISDLLGKTVVENQFFGGTFNVQRIVRYTRKKLCCLPQAANVLEYLLKHKNTISYLPEIIMKENIHVKNKEIVLRYLKNDIDYMLYLVYKKRVEEEQRELLHEIKTFLVQEAISI